MVIFIVVSIWFIDMCFGGSNDLKTIYNIKIPVVLQSESITIQTMTGKGLLYNSRQGTCCPVFRVSMNAILGQKGRHTFWLH